MADERFGEPGHKDSNWQQLIKAGLDLNDANLLPALTGGSLEETQASWQSRLQKELAAADLSIAMVGLGSDGHILGIKPGSPAVDSPDLVAAYSWEDYERITTTANLLTQMDHVVVYAIGAEKKEQLQKLNDELEINDQPAQILKLCKDVTIFNDQLGDNWEDKI